MFKKQAFIIILGMALVFIGGVSRVAALESHSSTTSQAHLLSNAAPTTLSPGFTYQGLLKTASGVPVNAVCSFVFKLYADSGGVTQVGGNSFANTITVNNGYFTAPVNVGDEFGPIAFDGGDRWLGVGVWCPGDIVYTSLGFQKLTGVPYASYAEKVGEHDHTGESWSSAGVTGLTVISDGGIGVRGRSMDSAYAGIEGENIYGIAIKSDGRFMSTADSTLYLSPHSMVVRGSSGVTLTPLDNGGVNINISTTGDKYLSIPINVIGQLFGTPFYINWVCVCYKATNASIVATAVSKNFLEGVENYILDINPRSSTWRDCYDVPAPTNKSINGSSWVQFNVNAPREVETW
jgi:hypothetical protein